MQLIDRVRQYYEENQLEDGKGSRLTCHSAENATVDGHVVVVKDSLGEVDIFYEPELYEVANELLPLPYSAMLKSVREGAEHNSTSKELQAHKMNVIAESSWNPYYMRSRMDLHSAAIAAQNYLTKKEGK